MATRYRRSNPLALALLSLLWEREMHPYEMATTLRERHKDESVKLNWGTLYTVVESLTKHGLIEVVEAERDGRRPERTRYRLAAAGLTELNDWLRELISVPHKEYPRFEAGVSLLGILPPEEAERLLGQRADTLAEQADGLRAVMAMLREQGLPALAWIELEYRVTMIEAEQRWVRGVAESIRANTIEGADWWRDWHARGAQPGQLPPFGPTTDVQSEVD
ncbi:PadR family transcriptional regulator [Crossiella cryophila]|uniref:DNA-binding PadR family transcriptional regulator n=1 Tax=Crossiella cryophila TaxID=43355 RepID=A0A7W7C7Z4_9PSEU|nr:PadR family transcriptional regulator [Crossiella cryophila]MBB4676210.1 DNA-binding PadR family transcriptional regulator [Crossiella cryophila]